MSTRIYFSHRLETLAARLAAELLADARGRDPFVPGQAGVIVPNPNIKKWLQLEISRRSGIAANLNFQHLQEGLWEVIGKFREAGESGPEPQLLTPEFLQLMVLTVLLGHLRRRTETGKALEPIAFMLYDPQGRPCRNYAQRLWQLAGRLARCFREYEFHRQEMVRDWLGGKLGQPASAEDPEVARMEKCQMSIYRELFRPEGLRDRLAAETGERRLTLSQYANQVLGKLEAAGQKAGNTAPQDDYPRLHVFGLSQISNFHRDLLFRLGRLLDISIYQLNVCSEFWEDVSTEREDRWVSIRQAEVSMNENREEELAWEESENMLLKWWGKPGRESLKLFSDLEERSIHEQELESFWLEPDEEGPGPETVLRTVQGQVLTRSQLGPEAPLEQDSSIQMAGCPGIYRELETVHESIIHNLLEDPDLNQTDIAVLVPDIAAYKPVLSAVFERHPQHLSYNLTDSSAARDSVYGQAVLALLELAGGNFSRREVFKLIFNPCFLAACDLEREDAQTWVQWADQLRIFHSFDHRDKAARGFNDNQLYTWHQGLQRLRLGRIMEAPEPSPADRGFRDYRQVVPFADMASQDTGNIGKFSLTVESLHRRLSKVHRGKMSCAEWLKVIEDLVETFLGIPANRPEEETVRRRLLDGLQDLCLIDPMLKLAGHDGGLDAEFISEFIKSQLEGIPSRHGSYLSGGVTVSELRSNRPIPFKLIYVLGLGEGKFPHGADYSSLDLRRPGRKLGDIAIPEEDRYIFLEALMAARYRFYLTYVSRDLQRDQIFHPCSLLVQLRNYLEKSVLHARFKMLELPLKGSSDRYLRTAGDENWQDLMVNFSPVDRLLCLQSLARREDPELDESARAQLAAAQERIEAEIARRRPELPPPASARTATPERTVLTLRDLELFLLNPLEAAVRRRLELYERETDSEDRSLAEDEPFYSEFELDCALTRDVLDFYLEKAAKTPKKESAQEASEEPQDYLRFLDEYYLDSRRRSRTPDGAFSDLDRHKLREKLRRRVEGGGEVARGLDSLLEELAGQALLRNVTIGEPRSSDPADLKFPPLRFQAGEPERVVEVHGTLPYVWRHPDAGVCSALVLSHSAKGTRNTPPKQVLMSFLFYLAALAGTEPNKQGQTSRELAGADKFTIYLANQKGILSYRYALQPETARQYLQQLVNNLLGPGAFDMLPFDIFLKLNRNQTNIPVPYYQDSEASAHEKANYARRLQQQVDEAMTNPWSDYNPGPVLKLVRGRVSPDAWDQIHARFALFFAIARA